MRTVSGEGAWPAVFGLDVGEAVEVEPERGGASRTVELREVTHRREPDRYVDASDGTTLAGASVTVAVDGERRTLEHRPYESPATVAGLRLLVETTREWATAGEIADVEGVDRDVRLSAVGAGEPWGPGGTRFPVADYRWRAASYANTWSALVPYNLLYYHRGEDFGAIPDRLDVRAPFDGRVVASPLPDGDGESNAVVVEAGDGTATRVRLAHMNVETIPDALTEGTRVAAGDVLGETGCTWDGRRSQTHDPHLHVGLHRGGTSLDPFPTLVEAYFRDYPDAVLPVAGGYYFALPGEEVRLDGSRSLARPGRSAGGHEWHLHDGRTVAGAEATVAYDEPGLYAEELVVEADDGTADRDFAQVRVWDPDATDPAAYGWVYHHPVRGVDPGEEVLFWNRLRYDGPVAVDLGDGATTTLDGDAEFAHAYDAPGTYVVAFEGADPDPDREPVTVKVRVVVEA